jgi:hypothetical protein
MDVVRRGVLIRSIAKLGRGLCGVSIEKKLNGNTTLPTTTTRVVGTLQMVFTNPIMIIHVNRIVDRLAMNSMATRRYKSASVANPRRGYRKPFIITAPVLDHRDGHYVRPNMVALKYTDLKNMLIQIFMS